MFIINWTEKGIRKCETYSAYHTNYEEVVDHIKGRADKNTSVTVSSI